MTEIVGSAPGHGAGFVAQSVAIGTVAAGTVAFTTGAEPLAGLVVSVNFTTEALAAILGGATFTLTQVTGTGLGATLAHTVASSDFGFTITATAAPAANTLYVFSWTG
jgi:hypothetical protein